jgi:transcriptional regulator with XRE-family HTH domain
MTLRKLGPMLRDLREQKGMTQAQLAKKAKVTRSYLAKMETSDQRNPSIAILQRLAKALGVPISELLE